MALIYPLKVLVTTDDDLIAEYNQNAVSVFLTSGAMSPDEFDSLLQQGAQFSAVVTVNKGGTDLFPKSPKDGVRRNLPKQCAISNVAILPTLALTEAVRLIHKEIDPSVYGMSAVGG